MKIDIGVINYNTKDLLKQCLDSIAEQEKTLLAKTIIVDNSSTDGSVDMLTNDYPETKIIRNERNVGFAVAANQIIKQAKNELVIVLNADTILQLKTISNLISFMEDMPRAGAVGPLLLNQDGSIQASGRNFPSFFEAIMHAFFGIIFPNNKFSRRYKKLDWDRNKREEVDWVSGAAICLRRQAVLDIGMFDEQYFMYVEDMDLCYRLWQNGWKVFLLPEARVTHYIGESSKQVSSKMIKEFEKSIYRFFVKQNAHSWKRILAPLVKVSLKLRSFLIINYSKIKK